MALSPSANELSIHINNAVNGKAYNITCIGCGYLVIVKSRGQIASHYSHDPKFYDSELSFMTGDSITNLLPT